VRDLLFDDLTWSVQYLVVETQNWWPGKTVLIAPSAARKIDWATNRNELEADRQMVKGSLGDDPSMTIDGAYEQ
jgi:hypothetical protein